MTTIRIADSKLIAEWAKDSGFTWSRDAALVTDPSNPADLYELLGHAAKAAADTVAQGDAFDYWETPEQRAEAYRRLASIVAAHNALAAVLDVPADSPQEYLEAAAARYANV